MNNPEVYALIEKLVNPDSNLVGVKRSVGYVNFKEDGGRQTLVVDCHQEGVDCVSIMLTKESCWIKQGAFGEAEKVLRIGCYDKSNQVVRVRHLHDLALELLERQNDDRANKCEQKFLNLWSKICEKKD